MFGCNHKKIMYFSKYKKMLISTDSIGHFNNTKNKRNENILLHKRKMKILVANYEISGLRTSCKQINILRALLS